MTVLFIHSASTFNLSKEYLGLHLGSKCSEDVEVKRHCLSFQGDRNLSNLFSLEMYEEKNRFSLGQLSSKIT